MEEYKKMSDKNASLLNLSTDDRIKIEEIDSNLKIEAALPEKEIDWFDAKEEGFVRYGIVPSSEDYLRLPRKVAEAVNTGVKELCDNPSGVRLRFCTDSPFIAIKAVYPSVCRFPHMPLSGSGGFDLYRQVNFLQTYVGTFVPPLEMQNGFEGLVYTDCPSGKSVNYILNFPPYNPLTKLYIGLKRGSVRKIPEGYGEQCSGTGDLQCKGTGRTACNQCSRRKV